MVTLLFILGMSLGWWAGWYHRRVRTRVESAIAGASSGTAVFMHGDLQVSKRRVKAPTYEQLRHHGRGKPDAYVYVGRNDKGEYVYQLVSD